MCAVAHEVRPNGDEDHGKGEMQENQRRHADLELELQNPEQD